MAPSLSFLARASLSLLLLSTAMTAPAAASSSNLFLGGDALQPRSNPHLSPYDLRNRAKEDRIVGGERAEGGRYPYSLPLGDSSQFCGGSLIAPNAVLTAAHCMDGEKLEDIFVWVGSDSIDGGTKVGFAAGYEHPDYDSNSDEYDLYIAILDTPVYDITPVRVNPNPNWPLPGMMATTMGWGVLKEDGNSPDELMRVEVEVISNDECDAYEDGGDDYNDWIFPDMVCTNTPGKDACQGDSGGPLIIESSDGDPANDVIFGVVSWGIGCAYMPGVYARPSAAYEWIVERVCEDHGGTGDLCGPAPTTASPTGSPTKFPTRFPTNNPTNFPTKTPTRFPTASPTESPTRRPTKYPSRSPTLRPTISPSKSPTVTPTDSPTTAEPTESPTLSPTGTPSISTQPTGSPSNSPTVSTMPTAQPSAAPTISQEPTGAPSASPTMTTQPSDSPTTTTMPTGLPSASPTISSVPTTSQSPSAMPSSIPSSSPSMTTAPSLMPSSKPTAGPSNAPTISTAPTVSTRPTVSKPPSEAAINLGSSLVLSEQSALSEGDAEGREDSSGVTGRCFAVSVLLGNLIAAWLVV